jgi:hypothetical protein
VNLALIRIKAESQEREFFQKVFDLQHDWEFAIDRVGQKVFMAQEALDPNAALEACALLKEVK